ncbi:hypothetical protein BS78_05G127500 [Paspalum vaginatum]|nr:hypothetical protein BS78_05G127500 [Paspalum vaginatum]
MGSSSLKDSLDFNHGIAFAEDIRLQLASSIHHPSSSPDGSFFLLVTFRRSSHRRFSVGFAVFHLKRFIGRSFDAYFHLWHNGVSNWEREKYLWEIEQAKEWTES